MAKQQSTQMMDLAQEMMNIQREYMLSTLQAMSPTQSADKDVNGVLEQEIETTRHAVEKTLALEEKAIDQLRRETKEIPGVNGMVDMMSEMSRGALEMRGKLWQTWFDQMHAVQNATPSTSKPTSTSSSTARS